MSTTSQQDLEEERRLFYVAITRAMSQVVLSYSKSRYRWGTKIYTTPSRFISEVDQKYLKLPQNFFENKDFNSLEHGSTPYYVDCSGVYGIHRNGKWATIPFYGCIGVRLVDDTITSKSIVNAANKQLSPLEDLIDEYFSLEL
jgi:hypothetical protein